VQKRRVAAEQRRSAKVMDDRDLLEESLFAVAIELKAIVMPGWSIGRDEDTLVVIGANTEDAFFSSEVWRLTHFVRYPQFFKIERVAGEFAEYKLFSHTGTGLRFSVLFTTDPSAAAKSSYRLRYSPDTIINSFAASSRARYAAACYPSGLPLLDDGDVD
jgi:hypothetical protein